MSHPARAPFAAPTVNPVASTTTGPVGAPRPAILDRRWMTIVLTAAVFVVASILAILRLPAGVRETVWAEDGVFFLADSDREGGWATLFKPYMGYLHVIPRLIVVAASQFADIAAFAVVVSVVCCVLVGALAALVFHCSSAVTDWLPARLAIASVTVLVPTAPIEVLGNAANLHWYLLWASVWLVLYTPKTWRGSVALGVLATSFALTSILVALLAPLVFYRFGAARMWPVRAGYAIGLIGQAVATLSYPRPTSSDPPDLLTTVHGYLIHGPSAVFVSSEEQLGGLLADTGWWVGAAYFAPFVLSWLYLLWRGRAVTRIAATTLLVLSIGVFSLALNGAVMSDYWDYANYSDEQFRALTIQRYSVIASMCLIPLPILSAATMRERWVSRDRDTALDRWMTRDAAALARRRRVPTLPSWLLRTPARLVPVAMVAVMLAGFTPDATRRDGFEPWSASVEEAREDCAGPPPTEPTPGVAIRSSPRDASLPIAPGGAWKTILSCSTLGTD